jgi:hypothetical protein
LRKKRVAGLADEFAGYEYNIFTLRLKDEDVLKTRVLDEKRSSEYRDWQSALAINKQLRSRPAYEHEVSIKADGKSIETITEDIRRLR